ncbi:hypothetical protein Axy14_024 [Achromobacter phage vB_AxyS_19-32_Axy14]|nr:hypothetical protein Axy14_024 [Achromobacter phage vB_AxyS_19-32_Axy14]
MPWKTMTLRGVKGSPLTNAEMDANLSTVLDFMNGVLLPQTAHDLNDYDVPGVYGQNATAGAVAGSNYPIDPIAGTPVAGVLYVHKGSPSDTSNISCQQEYKTYYNSNSTIFYRNRSSAGVWGAWVRIPKFDETLTSVMLSVATDANTLIAGNTRYLWTNGAVVNNGTNWPAMAAVARGMLEVIAFAPSQVYQRLTLPIAADGHPIIFERYGNPGTSWYAWRIAGPISSTTWLPTQNYGDVYVDGDGWYTWSGSTYNRARVAKVLPTTAHDLNTYTIPDVWWQNQSSAATLANNYPAEGITCFLEVKNFGNATLQEVSGRTTPFRKWWRMQTGASTWSAWKEYADMGSAMTHVFLTTATDANTMVLDNTFYTWTNSGALGANFPAFSTAWPSAGYMRVYYGAAAQVSQELTFLITGQKPRTFFRFGNSTTGAWQPWKSTSAWHVAVGFPTSDMGDIYVDGDGWYAWNGSSYVHRRTKITTRTDSLDLMDFAMGGLAANGAIIEQGSNANGIWIKFGDGTMLCVIATVLNLTGATFTSNGAFSYFAVGGTIAIPAAFAGAPVIVAASFSDNDIGSRACYLGSVGIATTTTVSGMYLVSPNPSLGAVGSSGVLRYLLLGAWK